MSAPPATIHILYLMDNASSRTRFSSWRIRACHASQAQAIVGTGQGSFKAAVDLGPGAGKIELKWTGAGGCALSSVSSGGRSVLSTFLSDGSNPDADASLLGMFLDSLRRTKPVLDHNPGNPSPFAKLQTVRDRPLYGAVLFPVVPKPSCDVILDFHTCCAAAFLWGMGRRAAGASTS